VTGRLLAVTTITGLENWMKDHGRFTTHMYQRILTECLIKQALLLEEAATEFTPATAATTRSNSSSKRSMWN